MLTSAAIRRIIKYLARKSTYTDLPDVNRRLSTRGAVYRPNKEKIFECYVDYNFAGAWYQADADNAENFMSRLGYVIRYTKCPVLWFSKLQTEIYLSTTELEYIALTQSISNIIPFIFLMKEKSFIFDIHIPNPEVFCKLFEDNQSYIAVAKLNKFPPIKKHITIKYNYL